MSTIAEEYDSLYESIDQRLFELSGEESPIVCILNKPLVMNMADLLDVIVDDLSEYVSKQKMRLLHSFENKSEIQMCISTAEGSIGVYSRHRTNYRNILLNYDEFISQLDPIERLIAINYSNGNPLLI